MYLFIEYPKCSTCKKAKKWLEENEISFQDRHIVEKCPTVEELKKWATESELPLKKFFNTSGNVYKELNLKEGLADMTEEEQFSLLASNGMLIKRPLIVGSGKVLIGFRPEEWKKELK